ncbi:MAG: NTP transferase domain-containing protein, partial [Acidobacteria bacterium]|nr:NTP transferase domain-containing protein [Acidobacteriota bacterium]
MTAAGDWPALVLTAGLGTRLQPLSSARAKAALPVGGDVLIRRILRWLRRAGVTRVVVNLHHRPETITRRLGDGRDLDVEVRYSWEDPVLGSAGGPRRALPLLDADRFFIVNGDTLTDVDIGAVRLAHEQSGALVTMAVVPGDTARYGGVLVRGNGHVTGFSWGNSRSPLLSTTAPAAPAAPVSYHFIGVQAVDARAFAEVPDGERSETVGSLYPSLIAKAVGSVRAYV